MKAFWISVALLIVMLIGVATNYIYINEVSDKILSHLDAIPDISDPNCVNAALSLHRSLEKEIDMISLSVGYSIVDRLCEETVTLCACAKSGDRYGFSTALALLYDAVEDMRRMEQFSMRNLL